MARYRLAALVFAVSAAAALGAPTVSGGWIRALPGNVPAGGYVTIINPSAKAIALTGASSGACGSVMLHMTHTMNGMSHMMEMSSIVVPANGKVDLKPGGYHLMCMQPKNLMPGMTVSITLTFSDGTTLNVPFAVRNAQGGVN